MAISPDLYLQLQRQFRQVFEAKWDRSELANFDELREKFAFHMADAFVHLNELSQACEQADAVADDSLAKRFELFLYHALPHLLAAGQIYDEVPEVFAEQKGVHDWQGFVDPLVRDRDHPAA